MFSREFTRQILAPAGVGRPSAFAEPLRVVAALVSASPALVVVGAYSREIERHPLDATAPSEPIVRAGLVSSSL
jgi:hypothetical protein